MDLLNDAVKHHILSSLPVRMQMTDCTSGVVKPRHDVYEHLEGKWSVNGQDRADLPPRTHVSVVHAVATDTASVEGLRLQQIDKETCPS